MLVQIVDSARICIDDSVHVLRIHSVPQPGAGARDQPLRLELVRVEQISAQRICIVGLSNVGKDEDAGLGGEALESMRGGHVWASRGTSRNDRGMSSRAAGAPEIGRRVDMMATRTVVFVVSRGCTAEPNLYIHPI
jgi:hypothetical protein